jgi:hypothetical protein
MFDHGTGIVVNAVRAARDDHTPGMAQIFNRYFAREDL